MRHEFDPGELASDIHQEALDNIGYAFLKGKLAALYAIRHKLENEGQLNIAIQKHIDELIEPIQEEMLREYRRT